MLSDFCTPLNRFTPSIIVGAPVSQTSFFNASAHCPTLSLLTRNCDSLSPGLPKSLWKYTLDANGKVAFWMFVTEKSFLYLLSRTIAEFAARAVKPFHAETGSRARVVAVMG